jgi:hypothetical protein
MVNRAADHRLVPRVHLVEEDAVFCSTKDGIFVFPFFCSDEPGTGQTFDYIYEKIMWTYVFIIVLRRAGSGSSFKCMRRFGIF